MKRDYTLKSGDIILFSPEVAKRVRLDILTFSTAFLGIRVRTDQWMLSQGKSILQRSTPFFELYSKAAMATLDDIIPKGYHGTMIKSFSCKETEKIFSGRFSKKLPRDIQRIPEHKLVMLHYAATLDDLRIPLANQLEKLSGDRQGQHSIRINRQWRICFKWHGDGIQNVEITDYH